MNILIIEDEIQTAWDVQHCIKSLRPQFSIQAIVDSIESGTEWLANHTSPDLVISDIQLGDGLVFDIFKKVEVQCPVIFCTAYDEYAIRAFQNNGIDYLLKPINELLLEKSLAKVESFTKRAAPYYGPALIDDVIKNISDRGKQYKNNFLVTYRNRLIPVHVQEIVFFQLEKGITELYTKEGKYTIADTLDGLESILDPKLFYRANRQFLVSYPAIQQIEYYHDRKLLLKLNTAPAPSIVISKAKASEFLRWMEER